MIAQKGCAWYAVSASESPGTNERDREKKASENKQFYSCIHTSSLNNMRKPSICPLSVNSMNLLELDNRDFAGVTAVDEKVGRGDVV